MVLTHRQRGTVAFIMNDPNRTPECCAPWDDEHCDEMAQWIPPLKVTGEAWEDAIAQALHHVEVRMDMRHPTWLTPPEIEERHGVIGPSPSPVEVVVRGRPTPLYNVGQVEGLPEEMYRLHWEIHPVNPGSRDPVFERFVSTLDVTIRHGVEKPEEGERAAYLPPTRSIRIPPFEMFFSPADYYLTLAHELTHWAEDSTTLVATARDPTDKWWELAAEFGAVFVCDELAVPATPRPRGVPTDYIEHWRLQKGFDAAEILAAAHDAALLAYWLCQIAPGWRATSDEPRWRPPQDDQRPRIPRNLADTTTPHPRLPILHAASRARALVVAVEALGRLDPRKDPTTWERQATQLLERSRKIDLTIPAVKAAIEAEVALTTPLDAVMPTAAIWLTAFQERTMRILAMRELVRSASKRTTATSPTRSITS